MKKLILITLMLICSSYARATEKQLVCGENVHTIRLEIGNYNPSGRLTNAYNGAGLTCSMISWLGQPDLPAGKAKCVGVWDSGYLANGDADEVVVTVLFTQDTHGKITANYRQNWDSRKHQAHPKVSIDCEIVER